MLSVCAAGPRASTVLSFLQHITMVLITIGYHIAAAQSMNYIAKEICRVRLVYSASHTLLCITSGPGTSVVWWIGNGLSRPTSASHHTNMFNRCSQSITFPYL